MTPAPTTTTTTPAPTGASSTTPPPAVPLSVALGPVQQSLLFLLLVALLRRLGILPPPDDDSQDVRYLLSSGTTEAALTQLRAQIALTRPWCLPQFDRLVQQLQSTGCTVIAGDLIGDCDMPRNLAELDLAVTRLENENRRLRDQLVEFGPRLTTVEKTVAAGPTVAQSLAAIAHNTDRMAKAAHGPYGGEQ